MGNELFPFLYIQNVLNTLFIKHWQHMLHLMVEDIRMINTTNQSLKSDHIVYQSNVVAKIVISSNDTMSNKNCQLCKSIMLHIYTTSTFLFHINTLNQETLNFHAVRHSCQTEVSRRTIVLLFTDL